MVSDPEKPDPDAPGVGVGVPVAEPESQPLSKGTAEAAEGDSSTSESEEADPKLASIKVNLAIKMMWSGLPYLVGLYHVKRMIFPAGPPAL